MVPTNTPVRLPRRVAGSMPACSKASHAVSSSRRCCGSMLCASRGEIPKNSASNSAAPYRNPPSRAYEVCGRSGSGSYSSARSQPRSVGNGPTASTSSVVSRHRSWGERTPPG